MTVTVYWPDRLPLPTFQDYGIEPMDSILRTEMESGPARQRERYTQVPTRVVARCRFTTWEFALFESWFVNKARRGGQFFGIYLLGGLGMVLHEARFVGRGQSPYKATPSRGGPGGGARWIVSFALEIRERPVLSSDALEIALAEDIPGLLSAGGSLNVLVNQTFKNNAW